VASTLSIGFQGAARTVTGSRHRIRFGDRRWLFDCGIYQGHRDEADRINRTFLEEPGTMDAVVISHAHLDHVGNLPTLVNQGFEGRIHLTPATADLASVMLPDSAFLMGKDVEHVNKHAHGRPLRKPLYTMEDVNTTLTRFETHGYHEPWTLFDGVRVEYWDAGHILGSALSVFEFAREGRTFRLGMSGDLGRPARRILRDPEVHPGVDALVLESTYGDRRHPPNLETESGLVDVVNRTLARGGRVMVPAFAVGRSQELLSTLLDLMDRKRIPDTQVFLDSPLAGEASQVFLRHTELWDAEARRQLERLRTEQGSGARLHFVGSPQESRALNDRTEPCIIVAASGMCEGGRILHHLQHGLGNARNTVLFVGFQGEGTLGRRIRDGVETVNIFGEPVVRRAEVASLDGFSAHADQGEILAWVSRLDPKPKDIFLVHGEIGSMETLAGLLREQIGSTVHIPEKNQEFPLWP